MLPRWGRTLGSPADGRRKIEARLLVFGAKAGKRKYPTLPPGEQLLQQFLEALHPTTGEKTQTYQPLGRCEKP